MTTQVVFTTEDKIKKQVMNQLKTDGLTLKTFLNTCMKEYLAGKFTCNVSLERIDEVDFTDQGKNKGIEAKDLLSKMKNFEKKYGQNY